MPRKRGRSGVQVLLSLFGSVVRERGWLEAGEGIQSHINSPAPSRERGWETRGAVVVGKMLNGVEKKKKEE